MSVSISISINIKLVDSKSLIMSFFRKNIAIVFDIGIGIIFNTSINIYSINTYINTVMKTFYS